MFKVGDIVRRKKEGLGWCWPHGDKTCRVVEVESTDLIAAVTLMRVDIDGAFKVASLFESAEPLPLWRDRLFADLRAAGASHEAATEFVAQAPSYERIAEEYRRDVEGVVDSLCGWWRTTTQGHDYWHKVHFAHVRRCGATP